VRTLNTLQTNASYLEQVKRQRSDPQAQLEAMEMYLARSGLQVRLYILQDISTLSARASPVAEARTFLSVVGGGLEPAKHYSCHWDQREGKSNPGVHVVDWCPSTFFCLFFWFWFFETGFLCVALAVLELTL
jgi:hypothetical protein